MCSKGNHHSAICPILAPSKEVLLKPTATAPPASQLDASASAWVGNIGSGERVALQTALTMVGGKRECLVRVLFDRGSQKSFITAKAASRLGLRSERSEELTISHLEVKEQMLLQERLKSQLKKLQQNPQVYEQYDEIFTQQNKDGIIAEVTELETERKVLFQDLCKEKLGWDDEIPQQSYLRWVAWPEDLQEIGTITVPRCVLTRDNGKVLSRQLHGFGDASKAAYCAMVYLVEQTTEGSFITLLSAKTRVAPLKQLTIPWLELRSARILTNLMSTVITAIGSQVEVDQIYYWLDSKTTLYWIFNGGEWKQFVQHRVNEILSLSKKESWSHVAGIDNPADLGSRGVTAI
eukprot:gene3850-biopygen3279